MPVGRSLRPWRSRAGRSEALASALRAGRSSRAGLVGSSDFPVRNPRILERSDCLGFGLFSRWADEVDRLPRSERRFDPRRDERRVPLGEYSDDMFSVIALHGHPAMRGRFPRKNGADGGSASNDAHPLASVCLMHTAKYMGDAMNSDLGPK
jgi:hypothetical protein